MATIDQNKEEFISLLRSTNREGIEKLIDWLCNKSDFFIAPSSTRFHGNYPGGLCQHSLNVYRIAKGFLPTCQLYSADPAKFSEITEDNIIIATLLHDLCKTNFYKPVQKYRKDENNNWELYNTYDIEDKFPFGHGEKSVFMAQRFINLTGNEALAIRWHMGCGDVGTYISDFSKYAATSAYNKVPLTTVVAISDFTASMLAEETIQ